MEGVGGGPVLILNEASVHQGEASPHTPAPFPAPRPRIVHPGNWESQQVSLSRQEGGWVSTGETLEGI